MNSEGEMKSHNWSERENVVQDQGEAFTACTRTNGEQARNDPRSCKTEIDVLIERAWGHSEPAARRARLISVALEQWPNKTPLDQPRELAKIDQDVRALSEMMGVRS